MASGFFAPKEKSKTAELHARELPWVEKYRPKTVSEVQQQEEVVKTLSTCIQSGSLPHLLFHGPPGTGKTSAILAIARELFGPTEIKKRVLEMNASQERGLSVVRSRIKQFAQLTVSAKPEGSEYPCPPFKLIILDEADSMTQDAQAALRRIIEDYSSVTRFCLLCNYVSKIIEPLTSRCAKFRFKPLDQSAMLGRLRYICEKEEMECSDEILLRLCSQSQGDFRKSIMCLQSARQLYGKSLSNDCDVTDIVGIIRPSVLDPLLGAFEKKSFEMVTEAVNFLLLDGYPALSLVRELFTIFLEISAGGRRGDLTISSMQMSQIASKIGEVDLCLTEGADETLQLLSLCSHVLGVL